MTVFLYYTFYYYFKVCFFHLLKKTVRKPICHTVLAEASSASQFMVSSFPFFFLRETVLRTLHLLNGSLLHEPCHHPFFMVTGRFPAESIAVVSVCCITKHVHVQYLGVLPYCSAGCGFVLSPATHASQRIHPHAVTVQTQVCLSLGNIYECLHVLLTSP